MPFCQVIVTEIAGKANDLRAIEKDVSEWEKRLSEVEIGRGKLDEIDGIETTDVTGKIARLREEWILFLERKEVWGTN